jgi:integrating conjugative element protein (TIGR03757 family)
MAQGAALPRQNPSQLPLESPRIKGARPDPRPLFRASARLNRVATGCGFAADRSLDSEWSSRPSWAFNAAPMPLPSATPSVSIKAFAILASLLAVTNDSGAHVPDILIVTDHQHPCSEYGGARLIDLDAPTIVTAALSRGLSADPERARALAAARVRDTASDERLARSYQDVVDAWSLGIEKIPAVIVDRKFVVYGDPNVARAVDRVATYRRTHL